jgi:GTPase-associated protein 1, N-terminal domain type 1
MADVLSSARIRVEQTLHGYADGHRLITGSIKPQGADGRAMLVLSDTSGAKLAAPTNGYLTGYPLPESSTFVLARTWAAPEMPRPGCVWTHSLLIEFADLAMLSSVEGLLELFRRPANPTAGYDNGIDLTASGLATSTSHPKAAALLNALYLDPVSKVEFRQGDAAEDEKLVLAVWLQQWPRLRRGFRFCTSVGTDRSTPTEPFDLQATAAASSQSRPSIQGARLVQTEPQSTTLQSALRDLQTPNGLRSFLRRVGGDVPKGRAAMAPLCALYDSLESVESSKPSFPIALDALEALGPGQARAARALVFDRALADIDALDDRTLRFVCENLEAGGDAVRPEVVAELANAIWRRSPGDLAAALDGEGPLASIANAAISKIDADALVIGIGGDVGLAEAIVMRRPDVLSQRSFWEARSLDAQRLLDLLGDEPADAVLDIVVAAGRADAAPSVVRRFGPVRVLDAIVASMPDGDPGRTAWLAEIARGASLLGSPLASGTLPRRIVVELSQHMNTDDVPNDYGDDPWAITARAGGDVGYREESRFAAFLMARALGWRSRSCAELLRQSFDRVHQSLADDSMPYEGWQMIERRLPWPMPWGAWDRCGRVREAVTAKFVDVDLDAETFGRLTDLDTVFTQLAEIAAQSRVGRRYLEKVRKRIRNEPEDFMQARTKIIGRLV